MTNQDLSLHAGLDRNYLACVKIKNPEKYSLLKKIGIHKYGNNTLQYKADIAKMYFEIEENKNMSMTSLYKKYLIETFASKHSFIRHVNNVSFRHSDKIISFKAYKNMQKTLAAYEKYKLEENQYG